MTWTEGEATEYELQRAASEAFHEPVTIYRGPDRGTFVSGLADGTYVYRVRGRDGGDWSPWSAPLTLEVQHWPMDRAIALLVLGGAVFVFTAGMIVVGHRRAEKEQA